MPPILAGFLTFACIAWLFIRNSKTDPGVSAVLWVPTIWVAIIASKPLGVWLGGGGVSANFEAYLDGSSVDRNALILLISIGVGVLMRRRLSWPEIRRANVGIFLFFVFMLISAIWSDYTFISFKRWVREIGNIVMILLILTEKNPVGAVRQVFLRCAFLLVPLCVLTMKYYPRTAVYFNFWTGDPYYCGVTTDKNALGRLAWVSCVFLLWSIDLRKSSGLFGTIRKCIPEILVLLMCFWILEKAQSATSIGCFVMAIIVLVALHVRWFRNNRKLLIATGCAIAALAVMFLAVPEVRRLGAESLGRRADLTDRSDIWQGAMALGTNPLVGSGFASVWLTREGHELAMRLDITEAHNGYLETYLNGGLLGVALLFAAMVAAARNTLQEIMDQSPVGPLFAALLLAGLIYNITEASFNNSSLVGFIFWMIAVSYPTGIPREPEYSSRQSNFHNPNSWQARSRTATSVSSAVGS